MNNITTSYNPFLQTVKKADSKLTNINKNILLSDRSTKDDTFTYAGNEETRALRQNFEKIKSQQGIIGKAWDGIKNLFGMKSGSKKVEEVIKQAEKGEITVEEANDSIKKYEEGQKTCVDVAADMASGIIAVGAFALAVPTGGASLAIGLAAATAAGAGVKIGIKAGDAIATGKEYNKKDLLYDFATGTVNGLFSPITNGIGASLTKTIGKKLGLKVVQEGAKEVAGQGIKQAAESVILTQSVDVIGGTIGKRAFALGAGMAVDGALGGASDNMVRAVLNGENVVEAGIQGAVGGAIAAPVIGGGFRIAGKAGHALNNKITTKIVLPDGINTKFKQGQTGDCALLSTIDGMMNNPSAAKSLKKSITKTAFGDYNVKIGDEIVRVSKSSLTDEMLSDTTGIKIFEQAYKQISGDIDGGFAETVAKQFGLNPVHITNDVITDEMLDKIAKEQNNTVLSLGTLIDSDGIISSTGSQRHYFTIKSIDSDAKTIKITSPYDTFKTIELSYDDVKTLGISIDGGSLKETDLPNIAREIDDVEFKGKKKNKKFQIVNPEDKQKLQDLKTYYSGNRKFEMTELLECIDPKLADAIHATGDIYTFDEIEAIENAYDLNLYPLEQILKHRGSIARINSENSNLNCCKVTELSSELKEYVENCLHFYDKADDRLALSIKKIDTLIDMYGNYTDNNILYRGVLDDEQIARLFSLLDYKMANPEKHVFYIPDRLVSTTIQKEVTENSYGKKCMMKIIVPNSNNTKSVSINELYKNLNLGQNDFSYQNEILFPSSVKFEILECQIIDDIPTFIVSL